MNQPQQIKAINVSNETPSRLERFALGFEYNLTLQEIKREVRLRTI